MSDKKSQMTLRIKKQRKCWHRMALRAKIDFVFLNEIKSISTIARNVKFFLEVLHD